MAKLCKMRVDDFSLFFGKRLFRVGVRNGTEYNVRMIPLGGFVKIAGMEPDDISNGAPIFKRRNVQKENKEIVLSGLKADALEGIDPDKISDRVHESVANSIGPDGNLTDWGKHELETLLASTAINPDEHHYLEVLLGTAILEPDPDGFNQKPLWQRASVIFAGPFLSLFFGYFLFCTMGFTSGLPEPKMKPSIGALSPGKPAEKAGMKPGDKIVAVNGNSIPDWESAVKAINASPEKPLQVSVLRKQESLTFTLTPYSFEDTIEEKGQKVKKTVGRIGIVPEMDKIWVHYSPLASIQRGTVLIYNLITGTLGAVFSRHVRENVGGPVAIIGVIHESGKEGPMQVVFTAALLSVSLGIINLFPIPILDGGHLMLLAIEGIRRRKLSSREVYAAQMVGISIIGMLFVLVMYNDISRLFAH